MTIKASEGKFKSIIRFLTAKQSGEIVNSRKDDFGKSKMSLSVSETGFTFSGSATWSHFATIPNVVPCINTEVTDIKTTAECHLKWNKTYKHTDRARYKY